VSTPVLSPVLGAVITALRARFTAAGVTVRLYDRDKAPVDVQAPYVIADYVPSGYGWDEGLGSPRCGWVGIQFTGVGKAQVDALWVLDRIREQLPLVDVATITATGVAVRSIQFEDPPSAAFDAGDLVNVTETALVYVEAT
jgi:hypothetical protein